MAKLRSLYTTGACVSDVPWRLSIPVERPARPNYYGLCRYEALVVLREWRAEQYPVKRLPWRIADKVNQQLVTI